MNAEQERFLRGWLDARDPGGPPATLRAEVARVPSTTSRSVFPAFDLAARRLFSLPAPARALLILAVLLAVAVAAAGAAILQPWRPFPPHGLIAFAVPLEAAGTSGIRLVGADGSGGRTLTPPTINTFEHSPRWSVDGRTLLVARVSNLDPLSACGGVGSIVLYDVATATPRVIATGLRPMGAAEWSPNGDRVAYLYPPPGCNAPGELGVVDVATGHVTTTPLGDGQWSLRWAGDSATAANVSVDAFGSVAAADVPSHDGAFLARWSGFPTGPAGSVGHLQMVNQQTEGLTDIGPGAAPTWSPDDGSIAFLQPGVPGGPTAVDLDRFPLAIIRVADGQVRVIGSVFWPEGMGIVPTVGVASPGDPTSPLFWTADGGAIYWIDIRGGHVVDVATGRSVDLPAVVNGCTDLRWQPAR